jgi:hypothetical protein
VLNAGLSTVEQAEHSHPPRPRQQTHDIMWQCDCTLSVGLETVSWTPCPSVSATVGISTTEIIWKYSYIRPITWGTIRTAVTNRNSSVDTEDCKVPTQTYLQRCDCYTIGHFDLFFTLHPLLLCNNHTFSNIFGVSRKQITTTASTQM